MPPARPFASLLILAPLALCACADDTAEPDQRRPPAGKADLPNDLLWEREHDGSGYRVIAKDYADNGYDVQVDLAQLAPSWPMTGSDTVALNRFGTPLQLGSSAYFHTAVDIFRSETSDSADVVAPFSGVARVYDWWGTPGYTAHDYGTVVAVWDPTSHSIAQLMHVRPTQELIDAGDFVNVTQGQKLGTLADDLDFLDAEHRDRLRHTHFDLIDGGNQIALNPIPHLPYHDATGPEVVSLYVLDEQAAAHSSLRTGRLDIVVEAFDRDQDSQRNFEVGSISFRITDDQSNVLLESERCMFEDLYNRIDSDYTLRTLKLIDFGNAKHQFGRGSWPSSDIDDVERTFRYALTQMKIADDGRCSAADDGDGFVDIAPEVQSITVEAVLWDQSGNSTSFSQVLERGDEPVDPIDPVEPVEPIDPVDPADPVAPSCEGQCGNMVVGDNGSSCYCDETCVEQGDCCADKEAFCPAPDPVDPVDPPPLSCEGSCGGSVTGEDGASCYCDDACEGHGDCCADKAAFCS